jgi:hypothetical protein
VFSLRKPVHLILSAVPLLAAAAAKFDRIVLRLVETAANDAARPSWHQDSFFRRFATEP